MRKAPANASLVLGDEYDVELRAALSETLRELGGAAVGQWRGVGGSQEIKTMSVMIDGKKLDVEAETYIGLSVSGDATLVEKIAALVRAKRPGQGA